MTGNRIPLSRKPRTVLLTTILEEHFLPRAVDVRHQKTIDHYRRAIRRFEESLERPPVIDDLNDTSILRAMRHSQNELGLEPATVNTLRKWLVSLATWCVDEGLLKKKPRIAKLPEPSNPPEALSDEQLKRLWEVAVTERGSIGGVPSRVWWPTIIWIEFDAALRAGELLALRWQWISWESKTIRVPYQHRKGRLRGAAYPISDTTIAWLREVFRYTADHPDGLVLGDVDSSTYYSRWDRIQERANLPRGRRWKTHVLRRTIATLTVICGGDPSAILRHSDPRVAREAYVDISRTAKPGSQIVAGLLGFMQSPDEVNREAAT